ncbi:HPr family phosphocarrier protein [Allorhodopirellula heiligendammensis]|uniref:Phosphocarrier protein HPr n=1 Tax=Allorhodopirellula heiligendammensis TaxID=2714739 RepID=A0A5C6C0S6_9BACT|nr:HPr family phosphocarrier protein [Allorhodopirellula heiligendammensis]TWU18173.1 Phosphocarrier protein HPr [Allorhodopirellula heiligendammensis]|tara:strand:- start:2473 stop:2784 length:312 start_codon:yes stop_codon:yes gene_type:complete
MNQPPLNNPPLLERTVCVVNPQGLHARPADLLVRCADGFESTIMIQKGAEQVDCRSILSLLTLGATEGTELKLTAQGQDAEHALAAICELFDQGFHENGQPSS